MKTVLETIRSGAPWLEKAGVDNARLNMEHLLAKVLGCRRMQLYLEFDRPLGEEQLAPLRDLVKRRSRREPLQHLLGNWDFLGREFLCDSRALIPRQETEELVEKIVADIRRDASLPSAILDMGTGSGVIGLTLALAFPAAVVTLADISPDALALARENASSLGIPNDRLAFVCTDLFAAIPPNERYELVAANLPYIPDCEIATLAPEVRCDPALALNGGPDGTELIARFVEHLPGHLAPGAHVALEVGAGQTDSVARMLRAVGLHDVRTQHDLSRRDRFVFARAP